MIQNTGARPISREFGERPLNPGRGSPGDGDAVITSRRTAELSHDLRVPLTSIAANLELIEEELAGNSDPNIAAALTRALRATDRMGRMLDQCMDGDLTGVGQRLAEVDLGQVARQLEADFGRLLQLAGARLQIGWLPLVQADPDGMYSVLQNLLTNALKFTSPDVPPRVSISSSPVAYGWRISVTDNGIGIPAEHRAEIFTMFARAHPSVEGHGIGLGTVARLVGDLDGRVGVDEARGGGTEVWFELPASCDG